MTNTKINITIAMMILFTGLLAGVTASALSAEETQENVYGVAIKGYDPVAYFTLGKAVKGNPDMSITWNEAVWHFADAKHRELFAANPKKYAPQHSGY